MTMHGNEFHGNDELGTETIEDPQELEPQPEDSVEDEPDTTDEEEDEGVLGLLEGWDA